MKQDSQAFTDHRFTAENLATNLLKTYELIVDSATSASKLCYHNNPISPVSKSWWTPELSRSKNILSFHFQQWKATGFLKDQNVSAIIVIKWQDKTFVMSSNQHKIKNFIKSISQSNL